jgi:hypothetical protein
MVERLALERLPPSKVGDGDLCRGNDLGTSRGKVRVRKKMRDARTETSSICKS